jgi:hypothetical protein
MIRIPLVVSFCLARSLHLTPEKQTKKGGKENGFRCGQNDCLTKLKRKPHEAGLPRNFEIASACQR